MADYYYYDKPQKRGDRFLSFIPRVTKNLLIINILVFVATLINEDFMVSTFSIFYPSSQYFRWWQPVTYMFMHGGFWHIFFNMYSLFIFGSVIEKAIGERKFLIFYFVCGLGAAALNMLVQYIEVQSLLTKIAEGSATAAQAYVNLKMTPCLGASGAIYGILIAYAMLYPESRLTLIFPPISLSAKWWVIIFAAIELFTGITGTAQGNGHFAHLGGMLFGWLMIMYWRKKGTLFNGK